MEDTARQNSANVSAYVSRFFASVAILTAVALGVGAPWSFLWLYGSGDVAVERVAERQAAGDFVIFGSGVSQEFSEYKLKLYEKIKPEIIAVGSSRVMQFRGAWFRKPFLNMGGVAGNLGVLRASLNELMALSRPRAVIIGVDFWWFLPQWEKDPEEKIEIERGGYNYGLENLKRPWLWLLEGKISLKEFVAPALGAFGEGFRADRFGVMAQQTSDGFGPDGSWYYTAEICGLKTPYDYQFRDTLKMVERGVKAFYHAGENQNGPDENFVDVFADICCRLKSRGVEVYVFIPPLSERVVAAMRERPKAYAHLFALREALLKRGVDALDFSDPRSLASNDCEFVDGFHGGEVTYARALRQLAERWPSLLEYVNMERLDAAIRDWSGHAMIPDERVSRAREIDFMKFNCPKRAAEFAD